MRKFNLFFLTAFFLILNINSQEQNSDLSKQFMITYDILGLEASYEIPLSDKFILDLGIGIGAGNYIKKTILNSNEFGPSLSTKTFPPVRLKSAIKYIYNREKRLKKNKNIVNNSGNYISIQTLFTSGQNVTDIKNPPNNSLLTELTWGIQRSLGGDWLLNFNVGIGYAKDFETNLSKTYPAVGLSFSYILF